MLHKSNTINKSLSKIFIKLFFFINVNRKRPVFLKVIRKRLITDLVLIERELVVIVEYKFLLANRLTILLKIF